MRTATVKRDGQEVGKRMTQETLARRQAEARARDFKERVEMLEIQLTYVCLPSCIYLHTAGIDTVDCLLPCTGR